MELEVAGYLFVYGLVNDAVNIHVVIIANIIICAGPSSRAVYGRSPAAIVGSNPTGGMDVCLL